MAARTRTRSHYQTLGVPRDATKAEVQRAYRALAKTLHPDSGKAADEKRFIEVTRAYESLTDPSARAKHDAELDGAAPPAAATAGTPHYTWSNVAARPPATEGRPAGPELDDLYDTFFGGGR